MFPKRYLTLDCWRGAAALSVFLYHRFLGRVSFVGGFWLAVQFFFVISGYCIAAAADEAVRRESGFGQFMRRRVRRIAPPYLASCAVAIVFRIVAKGGGVIVREWAMWLQNLTMTQWVWLVKQQFILHQPARTAFDNPQLLIGVYWSLNYEEQFYLIAGLVVVLASLRWLRPSVMFVLLTVPAIWINWRSPGMVTGLYTDYWLQFSCGIALYYRLCKVSDVRIKVGFDCVLVLILGVLGWESWRRGELSIDPHTYHFHGQLTLCVAFAGALVVLRPADAWLARTALGRLFGSFGKISYSLYLVHIPMLAALGGAEHKVNYYLGQGARDVFVVGAVLLSAYGFYRWFERPFMNQPPALPSPGSPRAAEASAASS